MVLQLGYTKAQGCGTSCSQSLWLSFASLALLFAIKLQGPYQTSLTSEAMVAQAVLDVMSVFL